jgi:hypothetical protein
MRTHRIPNRSIVTFQNTQFLCRTYILLTQYIHARLSQVLIKLKKMFAFEEMQIRNI